MLSKKLLPLFICLLQICICNTSAQVLIPVDSLKTDSYVYTKLDDYKLYLDGVTDNNKAALDKKLQSQYSKIIVEKNTSLIKDLKDKNFLFDGTVYIYLNSIFNHVLEQNSLDKSQFHFFVNRSVEPNAYTYEDGTIVCNIGLLNIVENESQLAMVFCHEIGHYLLKHPNAAIIKYLEKMNSPEFIAQLKAIQKQTYNSKAQLETLVMSDVFNRRKHDRSQESAADSIGMILFSKTKYNGSSVPRLFDLLDSSQNALNICSIKNFFTQEGISIDENWFKTVKKMSFGSTPKKEIVDSLKTHPDCAKRKIIAEVFFTKSPKPGVDFLIGDKDKLVSIRNTCLFDEATFSKYNSNLGFYFFQLIQNDSRFPGNGYIKTEIFNTLLSFCNHQKSHTLYSVVSTPYVSDDDKDEYAKLLRVLDMVDMKKLIDITSTYYEKNKTLIKTNNQSLTNLNQLKTSQL